MGNYRIYCLDPKFYDFSHGANKAQKTKRLPLWLCYNRWVQYISMTTSNKKSLWLKAISHVTSAVAFFFDLCCPIFKNANTITCCHRTRS